MSIYRTTVTPPRQYVWVNILNFTNTAKQLKCNIFCGQMSNKLNSRSFGQKKKKKKDQTNAGKSTLEARKALKETLCFVKTASESPLKQDLICPFNKEARS